MASFDSVFPNGTIPGAIASQARAAPDQKALLIGKDSLTYGELDFQVTRLIQYLVNHFGFKPEPVCLLVEKSPSQVVGFLAILGAGKFVVPLSISDPLSHFKEVFEQISPRLIFAEKSLHERLHGLAPAGCRILDPNTCHEDRCLSSLGRHPTLSPDSLATILFTSGSTGKPKGVMQTHHNWLNVIRRYSSALQLRSEDRLFRPGSFGFAAGVRALLGSLTHGATLLSNGQEDIDNILELIVSERATLLHTPVNLFRLLLNSDLGREDLKSLRCIFVAGDALRAEDAKTYLAKFPGKPKLIHALALTECSTIRQCIVDETLPLEEDFTPVGYPVEDVDILLLDNKNQKVATGERGQIAVRGPYLSPGYWNRPELTEEYFIADPEDSKDRVYLTGDLGEFRDNLLIHLGRLDSKTKIQGYQVEPRAVENAISAIKEVNESAVIVDKSGVEKTLLALVVVNADSSTTSREIRNRLEEFLASYMIPQAIILVEKIPRNAHGKLDLARLGPLNKLRQNRDTQYVAPRSKTEKQLVSIWQDVLSVRRVGIRDDLFDLGAQSLLIATINSRIRSLLKVDLPLRLIYERPCIAELSLEIDSSETLSQEKENTSTPYCSDGIDNTSGFQSAQTEGNLQTPATSVENLSKGANSEISQVVIFGNGSMARLRHAELLHDPKFEVVGFTVDQQCLQECKYLGLPIIPFEEVSERFPPLNHKMIIAVGHTKLNQLRAERCQLAKEMGYELANFISPRASVYPGVSMGENCRVGCLSAIQTGVRLGNNVLIGDGSIIGHDVSIEDDCFVSVGVTIAGGTQVGRSCFLGAGAVLRDGITIGPRSIIGAGATVLESTGEGEVLIAAGGERLSVKSDRMNL